MINKAILVGNLGADPEIRHTKAGKMIANLRVATSENWKDKASGERKSKTEWHRVTVFSEGLAKVAQDYLHKGDKVYVEGKIVTRKWTNKDGQDQYTTEIVIEGFGGVLKNMSPSTTGSGQASSTASNPIGNPLDDLEDLPI